jgi:hypothetical protein
MLTHECRVLKQLREEAGLSMRAAGLLLNVSSSMISQIVSSGLKSTVIAQR